MLRSPKQQFVSNVAEFKWHCLDLVEALSGAHSTHMKVTNLHFTQIEHIHFIPSQSPARCILAVLIVGMGHLFSVASVAAATEYQTRIWQEIRNWKQSMQVNLGHILLTSWTIIRTMLMRPRARTNSARVFPLPACYFTDVH